MKRAAPDQEHFPQQTAQRPRTWFRDVFAAGGKGKSWKRPMHSVLLPWTSLLGR